VVSHTPGLIAAASQSLRAVWSISSQTGRRSASLVEHPGRIYGTGSMYASRLCPDFGKCAAVIFDLFGSKMIELDATWCHV
jgi:hypothetical protein